MTVRRLVQLILIFRWPSPRRLRSKGPHQGINTTFRRLRDEALVPRETDQVLLRRALPLAAMMVIDFGVVMVMVIVMVVMVMVVVPQMVGLVHRVVGRRVAEAALRYHLMLLPFGRFATGVIGLGAELIVNL